MGETSWIEWPGWAFVGTVAQILSLVTLIAGAWRFTRQRRQFPLVMLDWTVIGTRTFDGLATYHVVEFRNLGRSTAIIQALEFCNGRIFVTDEYRAHWSVASGQSFQLLLTAADVDDVWFRTLVQAPDDRGRFILRWHALLAGSDLGRSQITEQAEWRSRSWAKRLRDFWRGVPVEPGGAPSSVMRGLKRRKAAARALSTSTQGPWSSALPGSREIPNLPVVPLGGQ